MSVTSTVDDYIELLPKLMFYGQVDWLKLQPGKNCGFYTYGDVFFKSFDPTVTAIYFIFKKTLSSTCELDATLQTFKNETWLYANSIYSDPKVCGYYVGVANGGSVDQMFSVIRTGAKLIKTSLMMMVGSAALALSMF